jgi:toxin ParE1/3/4
MITKTQIINTLDKLPENLTIDQVIDHLIFLEKVQKGLDDSASGRTTLQRRSQRKTPEMVKIIWTETAIQDIQDIAEYIAKDSVRYAEITALELFEAVDILEKHPKAGVKVPEFNEEAIRQLIRGNYRIVYIIIDDYRIDILTVHNTARLLKNVDPFK